MGNRRYWSEDAVIFQVEAVVLDKEEIAPGVFRLTLLAKEIAQTAQPGQFVHIRLDGGDFLLRRPFSINRRVSARHFQILFQTLGRGTAFLSRLEAPARLDVIGPLGTGFRVSTDVRRVLFVGGGLGVAPLPFVLDELADGVKTTLLLGAPSRDRLLILPEFRNRVEVQVTTEDGSQGERGLVTDILEKLIGAQRPEIILACGPEGMLEKVAQIASDQRIPCQVSLERRMACGVGACMSCVCHTNEGYKRVCQEGPVFEAGDILW